MAYCIAADVLLYVPNAKAGETFEGYIAEAEGIINANLREVFVTPLATVDQYVKTIAAKLAAASFLAAKLSQKRASTSDRAELLTEDAMAMLDKIKADPGMIAAERLDESAFADEEGSVMTSGRDSGPVFDLGDAGGWGE